MASEELPHSSECQIPLCNDNAIDILQKLKGFRLGHLNITSLTEYIDQLQLYLHNEPLDVLSINETRLDKDITDSVVSINGYEVTIETIETEKEVVRIGVRTVLLVRLKRPSLLNLIKYQQDCLKI